MRTKLRFFFIFLCAISIEAVHSETGTKTREALEKTADSVVTSIAAAENRESDKVTADFLRRQPSRKGMFVSVFDVKTRKLRGCMGSLVAEKANLYEEVTHWATMAMVFDTRGKTGKGKRKYAVIVSFIEGIEPVSDPLEVNSITHGIMVRVPGRQELVLPGEAFTTAYAMRIISGKFGFDAQRAGAEYFRIHAERFGAGIRLFKKFDGGYGG